MDIGTIKHQLKQVIQEIKDSTSNITINKILENFIISITGAERSSIWIYDNKSTLLREREENFVREVPIDAKKGLLYKCFATKKATITNYLASEKGYDSFIDNPDNIKMKSKIMIPLMDGDKFIGIATAYSSVKQIKNFDNDDLNILKAIAPDIISVIYQMQGNNSTRKRRDPDKTEEKSLRINSDSISNLEQIEESITTTQTPQELLDYVANIVHDIRTPSNGLFGFLEILEEQIDDPRLKKYISHAKESALLINELTTSILDDVSSKREVSQSKPEVVSTFKFFGNIAEIFSATMYKKKIKYNIFIDPLLPKEIIVENIKLKRIIMNLIGNANKFTAENETIEFSVRYKVKDKKIHIFVKDSGIGIAKDKQVQIFEAFKQAEDNTNQEYGGTGLGLAISAGYVKELGGKLLIDSELDKGSTFYFDIPIEINDESLKFNPINNKNIEVSILMDSKNTFVANNIARYLVKMGIVIDRISAVSNIDAIKEKTTHLIVFQDMINEKLFKSIETKKQKLMVVEENFLSLSKTNLYDSYLISQYGYIAETLYAYVDVKMVSKVLIVDDDKLSVVLIETMLSDELCDIDVAYDGESGLEMLTSALDNYNAYDVIYLDSHMPIFSGEELLRKYREIEKISGVKAIKAISISGDVCEDCRVENDFDIYLGKPFNKQEIKDVFYDSIK